MSATPADPLLDQAHVTFRDEALRLVTAVRLGLDDGQDPITVGCNFTAWFATWDPVVIRCVLSEAILLLATREEER